MSGRYNLNKLRVKVKVTEKKMRFLMLKRCPVFAAAPPLRLELLSAMFDTGERI